MRKKKSKAVKKDIAAYKEPMKRTPNITSKKGRFQDNRKVNVRKTRIG